MGAREKAVNQTIGLSVYNRFQWLWSRLFRPGCLLCAQAPSPGEDLCSDCQDELPHWPQGCPRCLSPMPAPSLLPCGQCLQREPAFATVWAPLAYAHPVDRFIQDFKFSANLAMGRSLSAMMLHRPPPTILPEALVPVPLHPTRLRKRGFNQSLELARHLGRAVGRPVIDCLLRTQATASQSGLNANRRQRNLSQAFKVGKVPDLGHVALVDDVMTTASTAHHCALALVRAGVQQVDVWVCARA
jgi:ComF family protein